MEGKMNVGLNVYERMALLNILPREGNILTLRVIRELREKLGLDDGEIKDMVVKLDSGGEKFDEKKASEAREINFKDTEQSIIKTALIGLNETKKLNLQLVSLYEAFVGKV